MGKYRFIQGESGNLKLNSKIILIRECFNINVCEYKFRKFIDKHGYVLRTVDLGEAGRSAVYIEEENSQHLDSYYFRDK